jgi:hypothetical protein
MASLEKSRNSLQTGVGVEALFILRCDRSPVMLTWFSSYFRFARHSARNQLQMSVCGGKKRMSKILKACRGFWIGRAWEA